LVFVAVATAKNAKEFLRVVLEREAGDFAQPALSKRDSKKVGRARQLGLGRASQVQNVRHGWQSRVQLKPKVK